jgi:hypothetical protein
MILAHGEQLAGEAVERAGMKRSIIIPDLDGTAWYAYRRRWKSHRNALGWEANKNAAYAGGWTPRSGAIADTVYARFSPHMILGVVEGKTLVEAIQDDQSILEAKRVVDLWPEMGEGSADAKQADSAHT